MICVCLWYFFMEFLYSDLYCELVFYMGCSISAPGISVPSRSRIKTCLRLSSHSHNMFLCCPNRAQYGSSTMTSRDKFSVKRYSGGMSAIDSGFHREQIAACYMMEAESEVAFIEVGTNSSTPRLMQTLASR